MVSQFEKEEIKLEKRISTLELDTGFKVSQIREALAILRSGTDCDKLHLEAILNDALTAKERKIS